MKTKIFSRLALLTTFVFSLACSTLFPPPTPSEMETLQTAQSMLSEMNTASPDGHLREFMKENSTTLTAKEVQYDMANKVGQNFGLSGKAELCDYYNWGYDESIKSEYFCTEITPSGGYSERWYIYFNREIGSELYKDLLDGKTVMVFVIAKIDESLYDENQGSMARGTIWEWNSW